MKEKFNLKWFRSDDIRVIVLSIVSSTLFILLVQPAIYLVQGMGNGLIQSLQNLYYTLCSRALATDISNAVCLFIFIGSIISIVVVIFYVSQMSTDENIMTETKLNRKHTNSDQLESADSNNSTKGGANKEATFFHILTFIVIILAILYTVYMSCYIISPVFKKSKFDLDIVMISPYVSDEKVKLLESDWTQMQTKSDYHEIYNFINSVRTTNHLH